jgi:O-antigen ligase
LVEGSSAPELAEEGRSRNAVMNRQSAEILKGIPPSVITVAMSLLVTAAVVLIVARYDIWVIAAAAVLLGGLALMLVKPEHATLIVLFVIYANLTVALVRFHEIPDLIAGSFFLLLGIPLTKYVVLEKQRIITNRTFFLMIAYFFVLLTSAFFSGAAGESSVRIVRYLLEGVMLYLLFLNTIRTREMLRKAIWTLILAGAFMGSISLYQELTRTYDNPLGGLAQIQRSQIGTGQMAFGGKQITRGRMAGPIGETNRYAQVLVVLLPLAFFRSLTEPSRALRRLALVACVPILCGILLTYSRGAAVALMVVMVIMLIRGDLKPKYLLLGLGGIVVVALVAAPHYAHRMYTTAYGMWAVASGDVGRADSSIRGRTTEQLATLKVFLDHPILGVGPGQTRLYMREYAESIGFKKIEKTRRSHNMYLEELANTGIIGFVAFMAIVLVTMRQLGRARRRWAQADPEIARTATAFWLSILAYLVTAVFLQLSYQRYYWLLLALAGAAVHIFGARGAEEEGGGLELGTRRAHWQLLRKRTECTK